MRLGISNLSGLRVAEFQRFVETEYHFPDVRKMVPAGLLGMNAEARELEAKIVELLETT